MTSCGALSAVLCAWREIGGRERGEEKRGNDKKRE